MGNSLTAFNLDSSGNKSLHVKRCPKYKTPFLKNSLFSGCSFNLYDLIWQIRLFVYLQIFAKNGYVVKVDEALF